MTPLDKVDHVRNAVLAAFDGMPVPKTDTLIDTIDIESAPLAEELRHELSGRTWQSLTPEFLKKWCFSFYYLRTEAYLYYLQALLIGAIADYDGDMELCHSVVHVLDPNFLALYYEGTDDNHQVFASTLSDQRYVVISEFLGLVFEKAPNWNYCAARTLYWGWNRIGTRELQTVRQHYLEMRSFLRPEPDDARIADLYHKIDKAFADTPYPGDENLCEDQRDPEPAQIALELRGVKWQNAHPALLDQCHSALSFLPNNAFRYFLPAFLVADLCGYKSNNDDPVFHLTHGLYDARIDCVDHNAVREVLDANGEHLKWVAVTFQEAVDELKKTPDPNPDPEWRHYIVSRLAPFNHRERVAIIHYLEYKAKDKFETTQINLALESYWRPSLS